MGSVGNREDSMNVPYEDWGKEMDMELIRDSDGVIIGHIEDKNFWDYEPYTVGGITRKKALDEIDGWKNDDGTYGTGDEAFYIAYKDGSFVNLTELNAGEKWKKTGIAGIYISTADYEMVWGGEVNKKTGEIEPYHTHEYNFETDEDYEGPANSYSSVKASATWKERIKTTHVRNPQTGRVETRREVLRKSTKKKLN